MGHGSLEDEHWFQHLTFGRFVSVVYSLNYVHYASFTPWEIY